MDTGFFMTQHSPAGAWASFTFGLPGHGVSLDRQTSVVKENADLYVGVSREGHLKLLPFVSGMAEVFREGGLNQEGSTTAKNDAPYTFIAPAQLKRHLTGAVDRFTADDVQLAVFTPPPRWSDPQVSPILAADLCPGILLEVTIDNRAFAQPAHGFIGLKSLELGRVRAINAFEDNGLCGIARGTEWALAAQATDQVYTIKSFDVRRSAALGEAPFHNVGMEGGIGFVVPAGQVVTLKVAFGVYLGGTVTAGVPGHYAYTKHFADVEAVCQGILEQANSLKAQAEAFDRTLAAQVTDAISYQTIAQAIRAYQACAQLIQTDRGLCYSVSEGAYMWRNTLDLAVDHLPWELKTTPWVVRNIMEWFLDQYSFVDEVRFEGHPGKTFAGGLSFTHDQGSYTAFAKPGQSMYETANMTQVHCYWHMTAEELLNGIACIAAYSLHTGDTAWLVRHAGLMDRLMTSLENRDHFEAAQRDGTLKATSQRCGELVEESTTYDSPPLGLMRVKGNSYMTVKTLSSLVLLAELAKKMGDQSVAQRAQSMAAKTEKTLAELVLPEGYLQPNRYDDSNRGRVVAALEPLALVAWLGLGDELKQRSSTWALLKRHAEACVGPQGCIDAATGGLRLNSLSSYTWVSKAITCLYVLEGVFGLPLKKEHPEVFTELQRWTQVIQAEVTISDQVLTAERRVIGGYYYPRAACAAFWMNR